VLEVWYRRRRRVGGRTVAFGPAPRLAGRRLAGQHLDGDVEFAVVEKLDQVDDVAADIALAAEEDLFLDVNTKTVGPAAFGTGTEPLLTPPTEADASAKELRLDRGLLRPPFLTIEVGHLDHRLRREGPYRRRGLLRRRAVPISEAPP
jgi:hypothetical protein